MAQRTGEEGPRPEVLLGMHPPDTWADSAACSTGPLDVDLSHSQRKQQHKPCASTVQRPGKLTLTQSLSAPSGYVIRAPANLVHKSRVPKNIKRLFNRPT